jgi:hypothetical protein
VVLPSSFTRRRLAATGVALAILTPAVAALAAPGARVAAKDSRVSANDSRVSAKDSFSGAISSATGTYAGRGGAVAVTLAPGAATGNARAVSVTVTGRRCADHRHCLTLLGHLHGTMRAAPRQVPDIGQKLSLQLTGRLAPLGQVGAGGSVQGTGFIARGRESLLLTLHGRQGSVTVHATSGVVPGFTGP